MKRHKMAMAASAGAYDDGPIGAAADHGRTGAYEESEHTPPALSEVGFVPASVNIREHTLILTGELDSSSAYALEAEIERLCDEGVTSITLDLRELRYIDSIGVAVIAFRCRLCQRRGYEFALIPGGRMIHRAFEQAGVAPLLPFQEQRVPLRQRKQAAAASAAAPPALLLSHRSRSGCEQ
jgi:anti-sigma B factor antagonist